MKIIQLTIVCAVLTGLSGCNTARGFGADLEMLGKKMKTMGNAEESVVVEGATVGTSQVETVYQDGVEVQTYPVNSQPVYQETYTEIPAAGTTGTTYPTEIIIQEGQVLQ